MTRPRVGIGIVSGGNRLAGTDGGREGTGPPAGKIRSRISSSPSLSFGCVATFILAKIFDNCILRSALHPQLARDPSRTYPSNSAEVT